MFDYEEFPGRFTDWITGVLSNGSTLDLAAKKLKLMQLVMELHYAGRKIAVGQLLCLINVTLTEYFVAYYFMQGLIYYFSMYPLKPTDPKLSYRPEDIASIRKKLITIKDITIGLFEK
jgi:hypothetical protein